MSLTNEERVRKWIDEHKNGTRTNAKKLGFALKLTPQFVGNCFKWMPGIRKFGPAGGSSQEWEVWKEGS